MLGDWRASRKEPTLVARNLSAPVVFFGGMWLAAYGDYQTLSFMAFLLPFALVYAMVMTWWALDLRKTQ